MSAVHYRRIEPVQCAGISIATFLDDNRSVIMVSLTDIVEALSMNVDLDEIKCEVYTAYTKSHQAVEHHAIPHSEVNHFLWMNNCSEAFVHDLEEFRTFFLHEVISFWDRFQYGAGSLSLRDALKVIDIKSIEYHKNLELISARIYQVAVTSMGYERIPLKDDLTNEELLFVVHAELLYASLAASFLEDEYSLGESMRMAEDRLEDALRALGNITRGLSKI